MKQIITRSECHWDNSARCCCRYQSIRRTITNSDRTEEAPADLLPEPESELIPHSFLGESTLWLKANVTHEKNKNQFTRGKRPDIFKCSYPNLQSTDGTVRWPTAADAPAFHCCCSHPAPSSCAAPTSSPCCIQTLSVHGALS